MSIYSLLSCGSLADSLLQLSFALGFSFSLIALCLLASSGFGTLAEFGTVASTLLARWPIVELASSINIPQWHLTKVQSRRIGNKNK